MAEITIFNNRETLINRGLSMRTINNELTDLFQRYSMLLNRILGDELMGNSQVRQIHSDQNGVFKEYSKGQIKIKNGIDNLSYLLEHRQTISSLIGIGLDDINKNKRDLAKVKNYLNLLKSNYELGNSQDPIQIYISKHDNNIGGLDSSLDWTDYILSQRWIDKLSTKANGGEYSPTDYRIEYLSDLMEGLLTDHIIDYHKNLESFDPSDFLSQPKMTIKNVEIDLPLEDAMNQLNSFGKLDYVFCELFKPIGGGKGKYIKVKLGTDGYVDMSGVVGLSNCEQFPWEYGSEAYLRSLNTGNQRYLLQLDMPLNDKNSVLWWKPDNEEKLNPEPPYDEEGNQKPTVKYYKEYEVERFLRWFGSDHIPRIDEDTIEKCTICSSPNLTDDTESDNFHSDARNIGESGMDLTRINIDDSTSQSLLYLHPKATVAIRTYFHDEANKTYRSPKTVAKEGEVLDDPSKIHQYLEFVVTGNRQTSNVAFNVKGYIGDDIQEKHHYLHTLRQMTGEMERLFNTMLFLQVSETIVPEIKIIWDGLNNRFWEDTVNATVRISEDWVPRNWIYLEDKLQELLKSPTTMDVLRFRQLDLETIILNNDSQLNIRIDGFLKKLDEDSDGFIDRYCQGDSSTLNELKSRMKGKKAFMQELWDYIDRYKNAKYQDELSNDLQKIAGLTDSQKANLITIPLEKMYGEKPKRTEGQATRMKFSSNGDWITYDIDGTLDKSALEDIGLVYKLDVEEGEIDIKRDYLLWLRKPYAIEIGTDVTEIGDYAFAKCASLTSIRIPASVEKIGEEIFRECPNLSNIKFVDRTFSQIKTIKDEDNHENYPWGLDYSEDKIEDEENDDYKYIFNKGEFSDVRVQTLRERISTFNNLIVRLPVSSKHNCLASKHIFQDWKAFVDGAVEYLIEKGELTPSEKQGIGSDMKKYTFNEYLTKDGKPLVDYSWLYDTTKTDGAMHPYVDKDKTEYNEGCDKEPIGDRFDYWRDGTLPPEDGEETPRDDFKWPQ